MSLLTWTEEHSVGVKEMDEQHQGIFDVINEFHYAMEQSQAEDILVSILQKLTDYAQAHFITEESYFDKFNFELKNRHTAQHKMYHEKVLNLINQAKVGTSKDLLSSETLEFLENWWLQHVNTEDKKYTQCFHDHGKF